MKKKSLTILIGVTAITLVAATLASRGRQTTAREPGEHNDLFATLRERINDIARIEVTDADQTATIERGDDGFVLVQRSGYPAQFTKVKETVLNLSELEVLEPKTAKPENFARLGVQDPDEPESTSKRIVVFDDSGAEIAGFVLGDSDYRGRKPSLYLRPSGANQVYECSGRLTVEADPLSWIEREIFKLEGSRVRTVEISHADGEELRIHREGQSNDYVLENIPPGKQEAFRGSANGVATALAYLRLDDVRPFAEVDFSLEPVCRAIYTMNDGLVITIELARFEDQTWAKLSASFERPEAATEGEDAALTEEDFQHAEVEARSLQRTFERWAYQLPEFKAEAIAKRGADLLSDIPREELEEVPGSTEDAPLEALPEGTPETVAPVEAGPEDSNPPGEPDDERR